MSSRSDYYETRLYPLQDGVLRCVEGCKTDFFLTGGTALSRGYYGHRYSDDLDFFVCSDFRFNAQVESVPAGLSDAAFRWSEEPSWEAFRADLAVIAFDLARGSENSLCRARIGT